MYPHAQFKALWTWFEGEVRSGAVTIAEVAFVEVGHKAPDCQALLAQFEINRHGIGQTEVQHALAIKAALGIVNDAYAGGVDESDILIIAVAKVKGLELVTSESRQTILPTLRANYKMPAVCNLPEAQVTSLRLIEYIRQSQQVF
ncbi:MAG: DUF4411 family protein [Fimbriimonas sp.]